MTSPNPQALVADPEHLQGEPPAMTHPEVLRALSGILLGMFVSVLAMSVVSSSLPKIITDLGGGQSAFTWVVTATLLTSTISTPIWGKLADLTNRKTLIQIALIISVLSAAAAGFAQDAGQLITFRAFQGIGAGGLQSLSAILIADIISPRQRGRYMGLMGSIMGIGMVGGPVLGGFLTDAINWRWNFFVGLPFAVASIIVLQMTLRLPKRPRGTEKLDIAGATLISVGIAALLLWITFAGTEFDWISWQTAALAGGALVVLATAVLVELRVKTPLIPMSLFKNRTLVLAVIGSVAVGVAMFGSSVFLSQYMQLSRGKTPTESGLYTIPMVVGLFLSSTVGGQLISKTGRYKPYMVGGAVSLTAGLLLLSTLDYRTSFVLVSIYLFILGAGVGLLMQNMVLATQNTLHIKDSGSGTSTVTFFRSLGGALGVSALGAILGHSVQGSLKEGITEIAPQLAKQGVDPSALQSGSGALPDLSVLPPILVEVIEKAYANGIAEIFLAAVPLAVIALICVSLIKEVPLDHRSGIDQLKDLEPTGA
ncbi:drug resistance transporter, EmrB/QacA subfamily [Promicromonospora umidemergens]|uniref:Major facilitator superfamily (MFS) profile domain-containing protein n=1 Tax=Promicromonospora umidemergens TaxID=629679 RepID=A0ABP8XGG0_9MICO|nr:MDR family MFS transporter [Promicromonospora umidemergens]MCP2284901.1 drug resistance transporter, EmrB/QacA subfamily [Promicromonospora umidemergens]